MRFSRALAMGTGTCFIRSRAGFAGFLALPCLLFLAGLFPLVSFFGFLLSGLDPSQRVFFPLTWVLFLFPGVLWAFLDRIEDNGNFRHLRSD